MRASILTVRRTRGRRPTRPSKCGGYWYLLRRVPAAMRGLDKRKFVKLSTGIRIADDPRGCAATNVVAILDGEIARYWEDLRAGRDADAILRHREAQIRALQLGFTYLPTSDVAALPINELGERLDLLITSRLLNNEHDVRALLGGCDSALGTRKLIYVSEMVKEMEGIASASLKSKSRNQKERWRTTRHRAASSMISAIGFDKPICNLTRADALALRRHWQERVLNEQVQIGTANKAIAFVVSMFRMINDHYQLELPNIFERISLRGGFAGIRTAFGASAIQDQFLAEGMFDRLNPEARRLLYLMIETGIRPSEACNLNRSTVVLGHEIPHILVRADGRQLKSKSAMRDIPLVGVALAAMKQQPDGFPRYRDKPNVVSAVLNKALVRRGLRSVSGTQTLYSIRHSFSDRLRNVQAPDSTVNYLMGHADRGPRYGDGLSLHAKLSWLLRIAFRPPLKV